MKGRQRVEKRIRGLPQPHTSQFYVHVVPTISRRGKAKKRESRLVVGRDQDKGMVSDCLRAVEFLLGVMNMFWNHNIVNIPNATELYTSKWLIRCYVNFTLIETKNEREIKTFSDKQYLREFIATKCGFRFPHPAIGRGQANSIGSLTDKKSPHQERVAQIIRG